MKGDLIFQILDLINLNNILTLSEAHRSFGGFLFVV